MRLSISDYIILNSNINEVYFEDTNVVESEIKVIEYDSTLY